MWVCYCNKIRNDLKGVETFSGVHNPTFSELTDSHDEIFVQLESHERLREAPDGGGKQSPVIIYCYFVRPDL